MPARFRRNSHVFRGDIMDTYLSSCGMFRKLMAKNETSLFRATAEQIYNNQRLHNEMQRCCVAYIERNSSKFENMNQMNAYIKALSLLYKHDFVIFRDIGRPPTHATNNGYPAKVILCNSFGCFFDLIYPKPHQEQAAIFQSVVYELLYKNVFGMQREVDTAVSLLRERGFWRNARQPYNGRQFHMSDDTNGIDHNVERAESDFESSTEYNKDDQLKRHMRLRGPPFPYKVAKILDPVIYRNIEYDGWLEEQKENFRIAHQLAQSQSSVLAEGSHCIVRLPDQGRLLTGVVQGTPPDDGTLTLAFPELNNETRIVPCSEVVLGRPGSNIQQYRRERSFSYSWAMDCRPFPPIRNANQFFNNNNSNVRFNGGNGPRMMIGGNLQQQQQPQPPNGRNGNSGINRFGEPFVATGGFRPQRFRRPALSPQQNYPSPSGAYNLQRPPRMNYDNRKQCKQAVFNKSSSIGQHHYVDNSQQMVDGGGGGYNFRQNFVASGERRYKGDIIYPPPTHNQSLPHESLMSSSPQQQQVQNLVPVCIAGGGGDMTPSQAVAIYQTKDSPPVTSSPIVGAPINSCPQAVENLMVTNEQNLPLKSSSTDSTNSQTNSGRKGTASNMDDSGGLSMLFGLSTTPDNSSGCGEFLSSGEQTDGSTKMQHVDGSGVVSTATAPQPIPGKQSATVLPLTGGGGGAKPVYSSQPMAAPLQQHHHRSAANAAAGGGAGCGHQNPHPHSAVPQATAVPLMPYVQPATAWSPVLQSSYVPAQQQTAVSFVPLVGVPYFDPATGPINYNAYPSQQTNGADLPFSDVTTLRYFFNLGCEYFRTFMNAQIQQVQEASTPPPVPQYLTAAQPPPQQLGQTHATPSGYYVQYAADLSGGGGYRSAAAVPLGAGGYESVLPASLTGANYHVTYNPYAAHRSL